MEIIKKIKDFDYKSLFKKKQEKAEPVWFVATKANIHHFKPGMFWYEDNTFSHDLFFNKALRAVVVKVKRRKIVGLMPIERTFGADGVNAFEERKPKTLENGVYQKCFGKLPRASDWRSICSQRDAVNRSLSEAGWLPLSGVYWCWSGLVHDYLSAVYDFDTAKKSKMANSAKGRYLIELTLI